MWRFLRYSDCMKTLLLFAMCAISALAADISGKWAGTAEGPNGALQRTFSFKVEGTKLTGETESEMIGKSVITDGKVDGDNITFSIKANFQGNEMTLNYTGKIVGDQIKLSVEIAAAGQAIEYTLKRAS
jgi:hypothetical protein